MIQLFFAFFKIGLFAVGGGLATLPFLYELAEESHWISTLDISNLVAISESSPGPLGVNMASYVGFLKGGPLGGAIATLGLITPSLIISIVIAQMLVRFKNSKVVKDIFYGLRAASCGLIAVAGVGVAKIAFFGERITDFFWPGAVLAICLFIATRKLKWHPIVFIAISAVIGIIFKFDL